MYAPGVKLLPAINPSPVPVPVPGTKLSVKLDVWSAPDESTTVQVVPPDGSVMSVPPFAWAWKKTAVEFLVTD